MQEVDKLAEGVWSAGKPHSNGHATYLYFTADQINPVMIWVCFFFLSLSHSVVHTLTHTHTHTHTHAYWHLHLSLSPTCLLFQSAFALLCSATCSHSFNQSLYFTASALVALCRIIVYHALYVFSCFFIVLRSCTLSCLAWRCWEFLVLPRCPAAASS